MRRTEVAPRYLNTRQLCEYVCASRNTAQKWAKEAGSMIYIGHAIRYDRELIDEYMNSKNRKVTA